MKASFSGLPRIGKMDSRMAIVCLWLHQCGTNFTYETHFCPYSTPYHFSHPTPTDHHLSSSSPHPTDHHQDPPEQSSQATPTKFTTPHESSPLAVQGHTPTNSVSIVTSAIGSPTTTIDQIFKTESLRKNLERMKLWICAESENDAGIRRVGIASRQRTDEFREV